jgi:hypothetical protein
MDLLEQFYNNVANYISPVYLVCFVLLAYGTREPFGAIVLQAFPQAQKPKTWGVFLFATILAIPFYFIENPIKLLVTYCVGTSFYDLIIDQVINRVTILIKGKPNNDN